MVERHEDCAGLERGDGDLAELDAVLDERGDALAGLDAAGHQRRSESRGALVECAHVTSRSP